MQRRFVTIWFRHLVADWLIRRQPDLKGVPFVLAAPQHGRMVVTAVSAKAAENGIHTGMVVADVRAIQPGLKVLDDQPEAPLKLLKALGEWIIRYTPISAIDVPDGLILDITGCPHLWGGEQAYLKDILTQLNDFSYHVRAVMADTIGAAWGLTRYGQQSYIIKSGAHKDAILSLPSAALRLDNAITERLDKLGLYDISSFISMPKVALRRRFGKMLLQRLDQALGLEEEHLQPIQPIPLYQERLPSMDGIRTAKGIEIGLKRLLEAICKRLDKEQKGLKKAIFKGFREDGHVQQIGIGTNRPSRNVEHLFRLFALKIGDMAPGFGFILFTLDVPLVEDLTAAQETLWNLSNNNDLEVASLLDRVAAKLGETTIHRYLPDEHYWPERSIKPATSLQEKPQTHWPTDRLRPVHLLVNPEPINVTAPIPDYPPMQFHYKGQLHTVAKADGPERIEQEWWLQDGEHRDYYCVEDDQGARYWLFRSGHYHEGEPEWFMHGFFA